MKAFFARGYGGPGEATFGELPDPVPGRGDVLVAVRAVSLNPLDIKVRRGDFRLLTGRRFPRILGCDLAGTVVGTGLGPSVFRPGDAVYGFVPPFARRPGTLAERVAVPARRLRTLHPGIPFETAACLPVAGLTAVNGLARCGNLKGKRVLVVGASGGVGHFAVQVARERGADVTAVCSGPKAGFARSLGAAAVVDYREGGPDTWGAGFHVVFDAHGTLGIRAASRLMAPGGRYASTLGTVGASLKVTIGRLLGMDRTVPAILSTGVGTWLALERLVLAGAVTPRVWAAFPLEEAASAFAALEEGRAAGKVVVLVNP